MGFNCNKYKEWKSDGVCEKCIHVDDCSQYEEMGLRKNKENIFIESEFAQIARAFLSEHFKLPEERLNQIIDNLCEAVIEVGDNQVTKYIRAIMAEKAKHYVDVTIHNQLQSMFDEAVEENVLVLGKDKSSTITTIQNIIMERTKEFFAEKDRRGNIDIKKTLNEAIGAKVDAMVQDSLDELKAECIEKFNKAVMKKMMAGMVNAISDDKRLLAVVGSEA